MPASNTASKRASAPAEQTLVIKRTFDAPRDLLWKVWSDPVQAKNWWGPEGFTAPIVELDMRPGGKWRAMMRAPDGKELCHHHLRGAREQDRYGFPAGCVYLGRRPERARRRLEPELRPLCRISENRRRTHECSLTMTPWQRSL